MHFASVWPVQNQGNLKIKEQYPFGKNQTAFQGSKTPKELNFNLESQKNNVLSTNSDI